MRAEGQEQTSQTPHNVAAAEPGWAVLHLFAAVGEATDPAAIELAIKSCLGDDHQVVTAAMLGHKADLGVVGLGASEQRLRALQNELVAAGCDLRYSYFSLTELSEYSVNLPEATRTARLRPTLPPPEMPAFCFYPMSKRREEVDNWYQLSYEQRLELMRAHGGVGREFAGRVLQLVTGSTGLDDYEWGVTLFGRRHEDLKDCVYRMRFDEASARYAQFGPFLSGTVGTAREVLNAIGLRA